MFKMLAKAVYGPKQEGETHYWRNIRRIEKRLKLGFRNLMDTIIAVLIVVMFIFVFFIYEPQEKPCYPVKCEHYTRELMGGRKIYEKHNCCYTHGHDCPSYD